MSTTGRGEALRSSGFSRAAGGAPDTTRQKITLPEAPADVSGLPNVAVSRHVPDRLTHVQVPFTWNLSPLRPSKFSFEYLLLHQDLHRRPLRRARARVLQRPPALLLIGAWRLPRRPGIGRALQRHPFSGLVDSAGELFTHSLADFDFHDHRPAVFNRPTPFVGSSLRIGRGRCAPDASNHWLYPIELAPSSSYPEGNFGGNQLLDGSISLSPLYPSQTNDLHVSIAAGLHQSFPLASPRSGIVHHLSGPDRHALTRTLLRRSRSVGGATLEGIRQSASLRPYGFTRPLTRTHVRLLGPCFKTGRMGSPQADARSAHVPGHAVTARAAVHDRGRRRLHGRFQRPGLLAAHRDPASVHAPSRSADAVTFHIRPGRIAGPHPLSLRQFQASLTLFSKSFFIFPSRYLFANGSLAVFSLGRNLPPDWGLHSQTTRLADSCLVVRQGPATTGLSPSPAPLSRGLGPGPPLRTLLQTTIRTPQAPDSQAGHFPRVVPPDWGRNESILEFRCPRVQEIPGRQAARTTVSEGLFKPRARRGRPSPRTRFWANASGSARETSIRPRPREPRGEGATMRDTQADVPSTRRPRAATCVQRLDGSRDSAIHTKYRISLRFSSMREPRYPLRESFRIITRRRRARRRGYGGALLVLISLALSRAGFVCRAAQGADASLHGSRGHGGAGCPPSPALSCHGFAGRSG
uniref:Uncharacterized protein n=1 Tax=Populus alba TaxID=43335 RepID=A0A4U5PXP1_POPAL|nr:hypothetical protein D5086_0000163710 [Populus alba]